MSTISTDHQAEALTNEIHTALKTSPHLARRSLQFETEHGRVTLEGKVASYFQKQMAQEVVLRVDGVEEIENLLEVTWT